MNKRHHIHNLRTFHKKSIHTSPKSVAGWIFWLFPSPIIVVLSVGCQFCQFRFKSHNVWDSNFAISFQIGNGAAVWKYTLNPSRGVPNTPIVFTDKVFVRPSSVQNVTTYIGMTGTTSHVLRGHWLPRLALEMCVRFRLMRTQSDMRTYVRTRFMHIGFPNPHKTKLKNPSIGLIRRPISSKNVLIFWPKVHAIS